MAYFKQLTGSKLPKKVKVFDKKTGIFKGNRYSIKTDKGSFNLRDYQKSVNLMSFSLVISLGNMSLI
jgi:hypothetical protein